MRTTTKTQRQCITINKKINTLIESNENKCITLLVHWNDYEIVEFHTIDTLMNQYDDIKQDKDISHVSYSFIKEKIYNTYNELFKNISVNEIVTIHNMTIVRLS